MTLASGNLPDGDSESASCAGNGQSADYQRAGTFNGALQWPNGTWDGKIETWKGRVTDVLEARLED